MAPFHENYTKDEEVTLSCNGGFQPSFTHVKCAGGAQAQNYSGSLNNNVWLGRKNGDAWIHIEGNIVCIETCKRPQWDPRLQLAPDQENYKKNEEVMLICPKDFQLFFTHVKCVGKFPFISNGKAVHREAWNGKDSRGDWIHIQSHVECIDVLQVVSESVEITSTSITLKWICRLPDACEHIRARCRLEEHSSPTCEAKEVKGEKMLQGQEGTFTCPPLQPFTVYSVTISLPPSTVLYTRLLTTKETVPDKPEKLWLNPNTGSLSWKPLPPCKGKIIGYQLNITTRRAHDDTFLEFKQVVVNQSVTQYTPPRQTPGSKYTVAVQGLTVAGAGAASILEFQTYISADMRAREDCASLPDPAAYRMAEPGHVCPQMVHTPNAMVGAVAGTWRRNALPSKPEEDHYTELQPYENVDNYCVVKGTLLAEEEAGKGGQAGEMLPQTPPVLESSRDSQSSEGEEKMRLKSPAQC
ncbi:PREDICTED: uncharacterized protein LOC106894031 [Calidris pugnax]|uniref:uncharacterized protein LOC106894031 n=1 Tax=Calidris pugnax TaxID=198806 RepID=UPI00071CC8A8|nr:PREDICTED: uncharacterized protein LOC106894031 [Calidris pugnax]